MVKCLECSNFLGPMGVLVKVIKFVRCCKCSCQVGDTAGSVLVQFVRCWECSNEVGELLEVLKFTKFKCVKVISAFIMKKNPKSIVLKVCCT